MKREVVIIGGGPAGLAAAIEAKRDGCDVLLVDENRRAGGQLFKQLHKFFGSRAHRAGVRGIDIGKQLLMETEELGIDFLFDTADALQVIIMGYDNLSVPGKLDI